MYRNIFETARLPRQSYRSVPVTEHDDSASEPDLEKRESLEDHAYNSGSISQSSSRRTSDSYYLPPPRRKILAWARRPLRFRRNSGCIFTFILGSTIIALALALWRLSAASARDVARGFQDVESKYHPWEEFPFLTRYYGGVRSILPQDKNTPEFPNEQAELEEIANLTNKGKADMPQEVQRRSGDSWRDMVVFDPYKNDTGAVACFLDERNGTEAPELYAHRGVVEGMPDPLFGSYDLLDMNRSVCFDRFGRLGGYGYGYTERRGGSGAGLEGDREGIDAIWTDSAQIDWREIKWADAQKRCVAKNQHRFTSGPSAESGKAARTAVLIRTWHEYQYDAEDIFYLRALISELAITTSGEFDVHFLVQVKDDNLQIWADEATHDKVLNASLPVEFAGMGTLWSERQMFLIYGGLEDSMFRDLPVHGVYRSTFMPVQWFAHKHPEYEHFWHWEMDVRYIGHYYELVDRVSRWAKSQPRKGLWERNSRFYVPSEHGPWDDFRHMVRVQTEHGKEQQEDKANSALSGQAGSDLEVSTQPRIERPIWGPVDSLAKSDRFEEEHDQKPQRTMKEDKDSWGVGEEADLIVFNPIFDPEGTEWLLTNDYTGYNSSAGAPPRRASIGTTGRYSRRLLDVMHRETALRRHTMFSEMWPPSICLHHGLKAVYVPHPVYIDRRWPTSYAAAIFNNGRHGSSGGSRRSVFSEDQQHNLLGTTWYYNAGFAPNLWTRWLGYKVNNDGGEEYETTGEGRMCLPSMLLHPVKHVELVREHGEWDEIAEDEDKIRQGTAKDGRIQD